MARDGWPTSGGFPPISTSPSFLSGASAESVPVRLPLLRLLRVLRGLSCRRRSALCLVRFFALFSCCFFRIKNYPFDHPLPCHSSLPDHPHHPSSLSVSSPLLAIPLCISPFSGSSHLRFRCLPLGRCSRLRDCPPSASSPGSASPVLRLCPLPIGSPRPSNFSLSSASSSASPGILLPLLGVPPPALLSLLQCVFGPSSVFCSPSKFHPEGVLCPLPAEMPRIAPGSDHLEVQVTLRATGTRADLVPPARITLYSCSTHQLLGFSGTSNPFDVRIRFQVFDMFLSPVALPLVCQRKEMCGRSRR